MRLTPDERGRIAGAARGSLATVPFAVLLDALARFQRTATIHLERRQVWKEVVLSRGVPVDCRSNLVHETLGRFLVSAGRLDEETFNGCLSESCARGLRLGEVLCERGLVDEDTLHRLLQQNLARKLLDLFSWREGDYEIRRAEVESTGLKINVAQLIVMGLTRFATQEQVDASIGSLIGKPLVLHPEPVYALADIRFGPQQLEVVEVLRGRPARIDELAQISSQDPRDLTRLLYALTLLEVVVPREALGGAAACRDHVLPFPQGAGDAEAGASARKMLLQLAGEYRELKPHELLGVEPKSGREAVETAFLAFAESYAPWRYTEALRQTATAVFLAGVRAVAGMTGSATSGPRPAGVRGERATGREDAAALPGRGQFRRHTTLLDPDIQFRKGRALLNAGEYRAALEQLEFASDLDPQNTTYLAELGFCRFLADPEGGAPAALEALAEVLRLHTRNGLALYYTGEILRRSGRHEEARPYLERAIKPLAPDRRPIEALKQLKAAQR